MDEGLWKVMRVLVAVLSVLLVVVWVWSMFQDSPVASSGNEWGAESTTQAPPGAPGGPLAFDPLFVQVSHEFFDEIATESGPSREGVKPTPAIVELHILTARTSSEVVDTTRFLPAMAEWVELDSCSSTVVWCATRNSSSGSTLLATWTLADESAGHEELRMVFTMSEN